MLNVTLCRNSMLLLLGMASASSLLPFSGQTAGAAAPKPMTSIPKNMFLVKPVTRNDAAHNNGGGAGKAELRIGQGRHFSYAKPDGWTVGEDGQFALTLVAPDRKALTIMVGNAGLPLSYPPAQFLHDKLMAMSPMNLQIGPPQPATPVAGFQHAVQFQVSYFAQGVPCRGIAKVNIAPSYDSAVMALTAALSAADQWPGYSGWLPLVADQVAATDGAAFGRRGIMAQNLANSRAYAEAASQYREWSKKTWDQVANDRNRSQDQQNFYRRENLGNVQTYVNPYNTQTTLELPTEYKYFWVDRQGTVLGTNDPLVNPNNGSTGDWRAMPRYKP